MKTCPSCRGEVPDEAIRCRHCGAPLGLEPPLPAPPTPGVQEALQYTHSGGRLLLGYGLDFFGIWDRAQPAAPIARYPRTDQGWRDAWVDFSRREPEAVEVGITSPSRPWVQPAPVQIAPRPVSAAWWLLPIFVGWLGGVIAWLVNKEIDPPKARAMLVTGIAVSVILFLVFVSVDPQP